MPQKSAKAKNTEEKSSALSISKHGKDELSKQQKDFNKWVKKIEKLREKLELTADSLARKNAFYTANIYPLNNDLVALNTTNVKALFTFYNDPKLLPKKDKTVLEDIMAEHMRVIFALSDKEPDEELKAILFAIDGLSFEEMKEESEAEAKADFINMCEEMGLDIDPDDFKEGMTLEEMMRIMSEKKEEYEKQQEQQEEQNAKKKKTKKQIEQEAKQKLKDEAKSKDISTIYRQLVKAFHPDLEKDETLKAQKEDIMKQLTVAYENNDLHTLLKIEIEWMQKEENNVNKLTDEKLSVYNDVLKEQVAELEREIYELPTHPRFSNLHRFVNFPSHITTLNMEKEKKEIEREIIELKDLEVSLKGSAALKVVKELIRQQRTSSSSYNAREIEQLMKLMFE